MRQTNLILLVIGIIFSIFATINVIFWNNSLIAFPLGLGTGFFTSRAIIKIIIERHTDREVREP